MSEAITNTFMIISQHKRVVLVLAIAVICISASGLSKIVIDNVLVEYFRGDTDISKSDRFIREKFGGSKAISMVIEAESSDILMHPDSLAAVDGLHTFIVEKIPSAGKVMGFTDFIKRINQVFNADESAEGLRPAAYQDEGSFGLGSFGLSFDSFSFAETEPLAIEDKSAARAAVPVSLPELVAFFKKAEGSGADRDISAGKIIWELQRLTNYEGATYYEIPSDPARYGKTTRDELRQLIYNYLVLYAGNLSDYANDALEPTAIRTMIQLRTTSSVETNAVLTQINEYTAANFPKNLRVIVGGPALIEDSLNSLVVQAQMLSVSISLLLVFIIVALSNRSIVAGIISVVPLAISIIINFAVMGFAGIKLNIATALVASLAVGIGIDYTIHYIDAYKREYLAYRGKSGFLRQTFAASGKAILINALSVGASFAVLIFSRFTMMANMGLLIALTMATAALVSLIVLPVLLQLIKPKFIYGLEQSPIGQRGQEK